MLEIESRGGSAGRESWTVVLCQVELELVDMLTESSKVFWSAYLDSLEPAQRPEGVKVLAGQAGDARVSDALLCLYLEGKKTAGSGLVADYEKSCDDLPEVGDHWIILDSGGTPRCIVQTVRVEFHLFREVTQEVATAEGEGDCSLASWRRGHRSFFAPYLERLGVKDLDEAMVVTEFFELVYKG